MCYKMAPVCLFFSLMCNLLSTVVLCIMALSQMGNWAADKRRLRLTVSAACLGKCDLYIVNAERTCAASERNERSKCTPFGFLDDMILPPTGRKVM